MYRCRAALVRNNLFGILSAVVLALAPFQAAHGARDATDATYYTLNTANGLSSNRVLQMAQLDDGRIVERGTHAELIKQRGIYYGMVRDQYRDFEKLTAGGGEANG